MREVAAATVKSDRTHLAWLDSLRALAALWVVAHHAWLTVGFHPDGPVQKVATAFLMRGRYAVTTFIALSGYSLALQASRSGWRLKDGYKEFLLARFIRIVPPYYLSIALSLLLIATVIGQPTGTHWDVSIPVTVPAVVKHLLMVQNFSGASKINHVYWSISIEFQIYLFFGLVLAALRLRGPAGAILFSFMLSAAAVVLYRTLPRVVPPSELIGDRSLVTFIPVFVMGVVACYASTKALANEWRWGAWVIPLGLVVAALGLTTTNQPAGDVLYGAGFATLLFTIATQPFLRRAFSFKPIAKLGLFAYSIYLVHAPLLQVVYNVVGRWSPQDDFSNSMLFLVVALPICVALAYLFYLACERPFFKLRHILRDRAKSPENPEPSVV